MDNLESQTYEVFEKDPIKYSQYQQVRQSDIFFGYEEAWHRCYREVFACPVDIQMQ